MPTYNFGSLSGSNRVGFQTRTWAIGRPSGITPDISGNSRILITDLQIGIARQANSTAWVSLQITGNSISTTSTSRPSLSTTTSTTQSYTPPLVTFPINNVTVGNVTGDFSLTTRAFTTQTGSTGTNGNQESTTSTDDIRIGLANGVTAYYGGFSYRMVPTAPTATSLSVSGTSYTLNWTAPSSNGDTPITSYVVEHADNASFTNQTVITGISATSTSRTVTGLSGRRYFRVYAINATGSSQRSSVLDATNVSAPTWSTTSFNQIARVGTTFTATVSAPGATEFALASGSLPADITLTAGTGANEGICTISGDVAAGASQAFNFRINATNTGGTTQSNQFTLNRRQPLPAWTDETLSTDLRVGTAYSDSVSASSASSYSVVGLPSGGLSLTSETVSGTFRARVSGTPTISSGISFTISATNSDSESISKAFTLTPKPRIPVWIDQTLSVTTIRVNQEYTDGVSADYATGYAVHSGSLPPGITLDTVFGGLTGTPTTAGTYSFVLRARNANDERIFTNTLTITVQPAGAGKVWNGSSWVQAPFKVWNGSSWVDAPARVWTSSSPPWTDAL